MRIVHIAPNTVFNEGWSYQENLLLKYQAKMGHEVTLITNVREHIGNKTVETLPCDYISKDGFRVIRLPYKNYRERHLTDIFSKLDVFDLLFELEPDFVFYHGLISRTIFDVIKYKKVSNKKSKKIHIVQDNHADYNIGHKTQTIMQRVLRQYYVCLNKRSQKHVERVYGVTPWRKQYAEDFYRIDPQKTSVLIMGADDEQLDFTKKQSVRTDIRNRYNISETDFLVVTGGRIDENKRTHILMDACGDAPGVKLLIFGSLSEKFENEFNTRLKKYDNIIYIGWLDSEKVYDYYFASDLVCFPGQHSVLWEQACASKVPCLFASWQGMDHVNNGGNSDFISEVTAEALRAKIDSLKFTEEYKKMKKTAESDATDIFLYSRIAEKAMECAD